MQPNLTDFRDDYLGVIRLPLLIRFVLHLLLTSVSVTLFKSHHSAGRRSDILHASRVSGYHYPCTRECSPVRLAAQNPWTPKIILLEYLAIFSGCPEQYNNIIINIHYISTWRKEIGEDFRHITLPGPKNVVGSAL